MALDWSSTRTSNTAIKTIGRHQNPFLRDGLPPGLSQMVCGRRVLPVATVNSYPDKPSMAEVREPPPGPRAFWGRHIAPSVHRQSDVINQQTEQWTPFSYCEKI